MALSSMTGFSAVTGRSGTLEWHWEARSVNGRGLDLRLRLPEGLERLEPEIRAAAQARLNRGSVQIGLRIAGGEGAAGLELNRETLARVLASAAEVARAAEAEGLRLAPISAGEILATRGVVEGVRLADRLADAAEAIAADIDPLLASLVAHRRSEGTALARVLAEQLDRLEGLTAAAAETAEARAARSGEVLRARVAALLGAQDRVDADRLAQELALLAVKSDVTEELDRLRAHIAATRALLAEGGPVGRKLDFLMQEFNREANTLCSKAQDPALTAIGLDLKLVIDQMREQCQNVE
ncbi:YicC family protein [Halovulum dunhuangense]|uniref:YicC family protein n=1 Tax=Halovulum dunhuangense TaxID=1505036 RepID=A0A849L2K3_9RHOB|nr:YicC/YloC family endoribonuclease [Halovulum dunhuangense]NNU80470.1 YicC family protein [Halovulum dunhuangense]